MIPIWWALLRFLKAVFIPPKFTELEEALFREITYLEARLVQERDKLDALTERIMFPNTPVQIEVPRGPHTLEPNISKEQAERKRLSDLSKQRWQEHVARQEMRAAELMQLDDARAKDARNETASGQSS